MLMAVFMSAISVFSQTEAPIFHIHNYADGAILQGMSDNGAYAVAYGRNPANDTWSSYPRLIDINGNKEISLLTEDEQATTTSVAARDVTDDGSIVVGTYNCLPGIWRESTGKWETLPVPEAPAGDSWCDGYVASVTPDGKYAVGTLSYKSLFGEQPVMWSLDGETPELIETPGWPKEAMNGVDHEQTRFIGITPDAKKILGCVAYSYMSDSFYFLYDRDTETYEVIGFDKKGGVFTPKFDGTLFVNSAALSSNGKYVGGTLYMAIPIEDSEFYNEYYAPYRYNLETLEFEAYDTTEDRGMLVPAIGNDGTLYGATPAGSPVRTWSARVDGYWYSFDQVLEQVYGIKFTDKTGFENSGTVIGVSDDGKRFASFPYPMGESYIVDLSMTMPELAAEIDLLSEYTVSPAAGTSFSKLTNVEVQFTRDVEVIAEKDAIELRDADGNVVKSSIKFALKTGSTKAVEIGFRTLELEADKEYFVVIPAGALQVVGDAKKTNDEISIKYIGRENSPVKMISVSPESGSSLGRINLTTNPVVVTFDATLTLGENAMAHLYLEGDNGDELVADMYLLVADNQALIYPINEQRLYLGSTYKVVVDANSVYDLTGENGNEEFSFTYVGSYEREIVAEGNVLFEESFDDYNVGLGNMMLYEGDHFTPTSEMSAWGFDADNTPWWLTRSSDEDMNNAATSHSAYTNAGKSDDWMVIPQLYLPDETCLLTFNSQSYRKAKQDRLSVYVLATDEVYNTLTTTAIEDFRKNAKLVFDGLQTPGTNEESLDGDWTENVIELAEFAGKNVYIAFVNENENQSAIFVDNVKVSRSVDFVISLEHESTVAAQNEAEIKGRVRVESETMKFASITLTLLDADGNEISTVSESGLNLAKDDIYTFTFDKKLPLEQGKVVTFTVKVKMDDVEDLAKGTIKNMYFVPTKRVVLEEGTGQGCQNCPLGHQMISLLHETYGDKFIPIAIHTYSGDIYGMGMSGYTSFLGISAYPSAMINRSGRITSPMESYSDESGVVQYRYTNPENPLWWDDVAAEFETLADADIKIGGGAQYDKEAETIRIPLEIRYALDMDNLNVNLFGVVLENGLSGYQQNAYSQMTDPIFGEWGQGGIYGQSTVAPFSFNEVARGVYGNTYNGTGGHIPTSVISGEVYETEINMPIPSTVREIENCDVVVMMIDANTGKVVNAVKGKLHDVLSVDTIGENAIVVRTVRESVVVETADDAQVQIYAGDGRLLAVAEGVGSIELPINGYRGVAIVRTLTNGNVTVNKVMINNL